MADPNETEMMESLNPGKNLHISKFWLNTVLGTEDTCRLDCF